MGSGNSKKEAHQQQANQQEREQQKISEYIKQIFRKSAVNGVLTKDKFNQALAILQGANFKRLRDTPLAERLFYLFDRNKNGMVNQRDFSEGINEILSDKNNAIMFSFKAIDADEDKRISKRQFVLFIEQSWKSAFRILGQNIEKNRDITNWATSQISTLNDKTTNLFNSLDVNRTGFIEFVAFREWMNNGNMYSIKAQLGGVEVEVPILYIKLKKLS